MIRKRGYADEARLVAAASATGRITSGTVVDPQKVCFDRTGVAVAEGMGSVREGRGESVLVVVVGQDCPPVGQDCPAVRCGFPVLGRDCPTSERGAVVVIQEFPVLGQDYPVAEQESVVVRHEFPVVGHDSLCSRHGVLQLRKGSLFPPTKRGHLFEHKSDPGNSGKSSRLDQTSKEVQGRLRSDSPFRSLSAILVFLLTVIHVTSGGQCPSSSEDLVSRTVLAKLVFIGQYLGQPSRREQDVEDHWTAEFKVVEPLKGTDLLSNSRVHVSGLLRDESGRGCAGGNFTVKGKYFVFVNASSVAQSEGNDEGPGQIYWTSGLSVVFSNPAKKTIKKYSCSDCAVAPTVKQLPRSLPPINKSGALTLRCRTSGFPTPTITWYKGTEVVSADGRRIRTTRHGTQLSVRRVNQSDAGTYKCQASNVLGSVNSTSVNVTVKASSSLPGNASTSPRYHVVPCGQQIFCVNGGTCFVNPSLGQFCLCPEQFTGLRCQDRSVKSGEKKTRPEPPSDPNLRNFFVVGLILVGLILLVLAVIAYCLAMTRYDNAQRMTHGTAEGAEESDVRANGALLRKMNGLQSEKQKKYTTSNGGTGADPSSSSIDDNKMVVGLPQVLVTLIEEEDSRTRTTITSGKGQQQLPVGANDRKRSEMRVHCPQDQCATFPNLSRPRLAAVSTTPSSAASSINLHMENTGPTSSMEEQLDSGSNC